MEVSIPIPFPSNKNLCNCSPAERTIIVGGNDHSIDQGGPIACPDQVDIVSICFWMLLQHLLDQLKDEADIVCFALLVVNVPASPVTTWGNNYCTMAEIIQSIQVA